MTKPIEDSANAAAHVSDLDIRAADNLLQVVGSLLPGDSATPLPQARPLPRRRRRRSVDR